MGMLAWSQKDDSVCTRRMGDCDSTFGARQRTHCVRNGEVPGRTRLDVGSAKQRLEARDTDIANRASMSSRNVGLQSAVRLARATACSSSRRRRQGAQALLGARLTRVDARFCFERREGRTRRGCIWVSKWGLHSLGRDVSEGAPVLPRPPRAIHQTRPPLDVDCRGQTRNSPRLRQSPPQPSPMAAPRLTPVAQLMVAPAALSRSPQPYCTGRVAPMFVCTDCLALALPGKRRRCAAMLCTGDAQVVAQSPFFSKFDHHLRSW